MAEPKRILERKGSWHREPTRAEREFAKQVLQMKMERKESEEGYPEFYRNRAKIAEFLVQMMVAKYGQDTVIDLVNSDYERVRMGIQSSLMKSLNAAVDPDMYGYRVGHRDWYIALEDRDPDGLAQRRLANLTITNVDTWRRGRVSYRKTPKSLQLVKLLFEVAGVEPKVEKRSDTSS